MFILPRHVPSSCPPRRWTLAGGFGLPSEKLSSKRNIQSQGQSVTLSPVIVTSRLWCATRSREGNSSKIRGIRSKFLLGFSASEGKAKSASNLLGVVAVVELPLGDVRFQANRTRIVSVPSRSPLIFMFSRSGMTLSMTHFQQLHCGLKHSFSVCTSLVDQLRQ